MHTDFATITGTRHAATAEFNQDYATARDTAAGRAWAIVADGCGGSGGRTDLGAREWVLAADQLLADKSLLDAPGAEIQLDLLTRADARLQQLPPEDALATLVLLEATPARLRAMFFGDGALLLRHGDGTVTFVNVQFDTNAPQYLAYHRQLRHLDQWQREYGHGHRRVVTNRLGADGELLGIRVHEESALAPLWAHALDLAREDIDLAIVTTDGIGSFEEPVKLFELARELTAVRSPTGAFLRRRLGRLGREWRTAGTLPADDLTVAGIWLRP